MNFTSIRYFLTIVEEGRISAAARKLYLSQQALSEQLKKLEAEVGTPLLQRSPVKLTPAGECFYTGCKKLISTYDAMMEEIGDITQKRRSKITIGVPTYCTPPYLPAFLGQFQAAHPEFEVAIVKRQHNDIERNMNGVDLYLSYLPLSPELENHILLDPDPYHVTFQRALAERVYGSRWEQVEQSLMERRDLSVLREMPFVILRDRYGQMSKDLQLIFAEYRFDPVISFNSENAELNDQTCYNSLGCLLSTESYANHRFYANPGLNTAELLSYPIRVTSFDPKMAVSHEKRLRLHPAERCFIKELRDFAQASRL